MKKIKALLLVALGMLLPIITQAQSETLDTLRINNMIDFRSGLLAPISNNVNPFIYRSKDANTTYPFNQNGNLILQTRTSANRDIVFMAGSPTAVPVMNITSAGDVGIGTSSPTQKLHVNGSFKAGISTHNLLASYSEVSDYNILRFTATNAGDDNFIISYGSNNNISPYQLALKSNQGINSSLGFYTDAVERMRVDEAGNVGIGTSSPSKPLHIISSTEHHQIRIEGTNNKHAWIQYFPSGSGLLNWQTGVNLSGYSIYDVSNSEYRLTVNNSGNVGIGTTTPGNKLEVNGTIRSKEVKVEATSWPDYVFEESYDLPTLSEIEAFIKANKHLPEVPSAKEVEANGIALGAMNTVLLKKIEEMTLHLIQQSKLAQLQQRKNDMLEKRLDELEKEIRKLKKGN